MKSGSSEQSSGEYTTESRDDGVELKGHSDTASAVSAAHSPDSPAVQTAEAQVTRRLAAENIDTERVPIQWLFKIIENVIGKRPESLAKYIRADGSSYCIIGFADPSDARRVYDFCDGLLIEDTREVFDLSFVPDSLQLSNPVDICTDIDGYRFQKYRRAAAEAADTFSDPFDEELEQDAATENVPANTKADAKASAKQQKDTVHLKEALSEHPVQDELEDFQFNIEDDRFSRLFTDPDFSLDTSSKRFREQKESVSILETIRKQYDKL